MSPEIEWIVEYDDLPPDDAPLPPPLTPNQRSLPRWFWLLSVLVLCSAVFVFWLWQLGGKSPPLPPPDKPPARTQLETAVQLEISALNIGDREIFERLQDSPTRRQNFELPHDIWFGKGRTAETRGELRYLDSQILDEQNGRAQIELTWQGKSYKLNWFYRQRNGRWLHTDWLPSNLGPKVELSSQHIVIKCHQSEVEQLEGLLDQLEDYVVNLCHRLPCPGEPFQLVLHTSPIYTDYSVDTIPPGTAAQAQLQPISQPASNVSPPAVFPTPHYYIPSPLRLRWPSDGRGDPVLLDSIGRHIVHDLYLAQALPHLDEENQMALTLVYFWLAHDLLDLPPLPTTRWLDEWVAINGKGAPSSLIRNLAQNHSAPSTLAEVLGDFTPKRSSFTVQYVPDYFGLLAAKDPNCWWFHLPIIPPLDQGAWLTRLDWQANPWTSRDETYNQVLPAVNQLARHNDWIIAYSDLMTSWPAVFYFRPKGDHWVLDAPDESLMGPQRTITQGQISLLYWAWDEPYEEQARQAIDHALQTTADNFGLPLAALVEFILAPAYMFGQTSWLPGKETQTLVLPSPAASDLHPPNYQSNWRWSLARYSTDLFLGPFIHSTSTNSRWSFIQALISWQMAQPMTDFGITLSPTSFVWGEFWPVPAVVDDPEWVSLVDLRQDYTIGTPESNYLQRPSQVWLVVSYIVDTYGREKLPLILRTIDTVDSMDEWITAITGRPLAEFKPTWRQWVVDQNFQRDG